MGKKRWIIYGANGYTGQLIACEARRRKLTPVLAGRSEAKITALAEKLDCECRFFPLKEPTEIARHLEDVTVVLHCAGPFSATSAPMLEACLLSKTHYLDITGEIAVFEYAFEQDERARSAGVIICPGVGFDVIPTDCIAASLKRVLPDADHLALGFASRSGYSSGTAKTAVEGFGQGGKIRRAGGIIRVPLAYKVRQIDFGDGEQRAMTIPWGDVSSAYYTTGIPNIEIYIAATPGVIAWARMLNTLRPLLALSLVQGFLQRRITNRVTGPSESQRQQLPAYVWGEVSNTAGESRTARIRTANGYEVTVNGSLGVVLKLLDDPPAGGSYTPSQLMGSGFVSTLPGSGELVIG